MSLNCDWCELCLPKVLSDTSATMIFSLGDRLSFNMLLKHALLSSGKFTLLSYLSAYRLNFFDLVYIAYVYLFNINFTGHIFYN